MTIDSWNVVAQCLERIRADPEREFLVLRLVDSWWRVSYAEFLEHVDACRGGLAALGVGAGDRVAIVAPNRLEWMVACYAILGHGAVVVPIDPSRPELFARLLADSGARVALGGGPAILEILREGQRNPPSTMHLIGLDEVGPNGWSFARLVEAGRRRPVACAHLTPGQPATIVYRSAERRDLDHGTLFAATRALQTGLGLAHEDVVLLTAPWGRGLGLLATLAALGAGASLVIDGVGAFASHATETHATVVISAAESLQRLGDEVEREIAARPAPVRSILRRGFAAADRRHRGEPVSWLDARVADLAGRMLSNVGAHPWGPRVRCVVSTEPTMLGTMGVPVRALEELCPLK